MPLQAHFTQSYRGSISTVIKCIDTTSAKYNSKERFTKYVLATFKSNHSFMVQFALHVLSDNNPYKNIPLVFHGQSMVQFPWNTMEYPWSSSHRTPWRIHGQYHRKSMVIHMDSHGNTMEFSWSLRWIFHGFLGLDHGFIISTMQKPWNTHGFSMYFPWSIHGISCGVFEYGHGKKMGIP